MYQIQYQPLISLSCPITTTLVSDIQQVLSIIYVNEVHHLDLQIILSQSSLNLPFFHCYPYNLGLHSYYLKVGFQISTSLKLYRPYKAYHLKFTPLLSKQQKYPSIYLLYIPLLLSYHNEKINYLGVKSYSLMVVLITR